MSSSPLSSSPPLVSSSSSSSFASSPPLTLMSSSASSPPSTSSSSSSLTSSSLWRQYHFTIIRSGILSTVNIFFIIIGIRSSSVSSPSLSKCCTWAVGTVLDGHLLSWICGLHSQKQQDGLYFLHNLQCLMVFFSPLCLDRGRWPLLTVLFTPFLLCLFSCNCKTCIHFDARLCQFHPQMCDVFRHSWKYVGKQCMSESF